MKAALIFTAFAVAGLQMLLFTYAWSSLVHLAIQQGRKDMAGLLRRSSGG